MSTARSPETDAFPARSRYDRDDERLTVVVDVFPAGIDDVSVAVGTTRLRISVDRGPTVSDGYVAPPNGTVFTGDGRATCNNGVLTVTAETARPRSRAPSARGDD